MTQYTNSLSIKGLLCPNSLSIKGLLCPDCKKESIEFHPKTNKMLICGNTTCGRYVVWEMRE